MEIALVPSPLVGPLTWAAVAEGLAAGGHPTVVPPLPLPADGAIWEAQAEAVAREVRSELGTGSVTLVGHSGAGPLLPAVGARLGLPVAAYVFVDAGLPHPGRSRLEAMPAELARKLRTVASEGWLPRWSDWWEPGALEDLLPDVRLRARFAADLPRVPLRLLEEPLPETSAWPDAPCAYLRLSDAYEEEARRAAREGWRLARFDGHHLSMLVESEAVAEDIVRLAA